MRNRFSVSVTGIVALFAALGPIAQAQEPASCKVFDLVSKKYDVLPEELRPREAELQAVVAAGLISHILTQEAAAKTLVEMSALKSSSLSRIIGIQKEIQALANAESRLLLEYRVANSVASQGYENLRYLEWKIFKQGNSKLSETLASAKVSLGERLAQLEGAEHEYHKLLATLAERRAELKKLTDTLKATRLGTSTAVALKGSGKILGKAALVLTVIDVLSTKGDSESEDLAFVDPLHKRKYPGADYYVREPLALLGLNRADACAKLSSDSEVEARFLELVSLSLGKDSMTNVDPRELVESSEAKEKKAPAAPLYTPAVPVGTYSGSAG